MLLPQYLLHDVHRKQHRQPNRLTSRTGNGCRVSGLRTIHLAADNMTDAHLMKILSDTCARLEPDRAANYLIESDCSYPDIAAEKDYFL